MSLAERLRAVQQAERACKAQAEKARVTWDALKVRATDAATPWRIVTVGAVSGFIMGRSGGVVSADATGALGSKLFTTVAESLIATLGASVAAGAAAAAAEFEIGAEEVPVESDSEAAAPLQQEA